MGVLRRMIGAVALAPALAAIQPALAHAAACPAFAPANETTGHIADSSLTELSDFVASSDNPGVFWTEDDSFNPNRVYAVNASGTIVMVDPITHDVYIVEKLIESVGGQSQVFVYKFDQPLNTGSTNIARKVGFVTTAKKFTSADISADGQLIGLKSGKAAWIWPRTGGTVEATFSATHAAPCEGAPLVGSEALGFAPDGLWTVPDGTNPPIVRLPFAS